MSSPSAATALRGDADSILKGGDLRDHSPLDILTAAHQQQFTGALYFKGFGGERITVFAMEGDLIAAESEDDLKSFGKRLTHRGALEAEQLKAVLDAAPDITTLGEKIRGQKWMKGAEIDQHLSDQFIDTLNHAYLLNQGSYRVEKLDAVFAGNLQLFFDTDDLLGEGKSITDKLLPLYTVLKQGEYGLTRGSAHAAVSLNDDEKELIVGSQKYTEFLELYRKQPLPLVPLLKLVAGLLERKVMALKPIAGADTPTVEDRSRKDKKAGIFMSQDTVLDKVDLSHVTHFAVATDIPLSGVIETVGVEDMEEHERKLRRANRPPKAPPQKAAPPKKGNPPPKKPPTKNIKRASGASSAAFDDSDEFIITEDGQAVTDGDDDGALNAPIRSGRTPDEKPAKSAPTPAPAPTPTHIVLTAPQKQSLRRRAQVYNRIYRLLFGNAILHTRKSDALGQFQSFFTNGAGTYPELFKGVQFRSDGTLNVHGLIENLESQTYKRAFEVFDLALHEALSHLMSHTLSLCPDEESKQQLKEEVDQIRRILFRPGAPMPTLRG